MAQPKIKKETIEYPNGHSSVIIKIDWMKRTFKFGKVKASSFATPTDIQNMYALAASYALQRLDASTS